MSVTTVETIINDRVKITLQELAENGTRWTNAELMGWLNESYQTIIGLRPDAASVNEDLALVAGTKQSIPASGLRLLDVVRNTATSSNKRGVILASRRQLDSTRRDWHGEPEQVSIEHYIFDDADPRNFYVYPPASVGATLEIIYSQVPVGHDYSVSKTDAIKLPDTYAPAITDWIMFRCFSKDAEHAANANRAQSHQAAFMNALGQKTATDSATSPNGKV